ncbi:MAG: hypothetical protein MZV64_71635 [Ignavibacteriales bacterium]|nr:hypothetical protein [Ignavibacteriales bacterium]
MEIFQDLISSSVGFNPRSMKRLFNSFQLFNLVAKEKEVLTGNAERQRVIFAVLCLQTAFDPVYHYLAKHIDTLSQETLNALQDPDTTTTDPQWKELWQELSNEDGILLRQRLSHFGKAFYRAIQLRTDGNEETLSDDEINTLQAVMQFSTITSTDSASHSPTRTTRQIDGAIKSLIYKLAKELNSRFEAHPLEIHAVREPPEKQSTTVWCDAHIQLGGWDSLGFWLHNEDNYACARLIASNKDCFKVTKQWVEAHCSSEFTKIQQLPKWKEVWLEEINFAAEDKLATRQQRFEELTYHCAEIILPKLAAQTQVIFESLESFWSAFQSRLKDRLDPSAWEIEKRSGWEKATHNFDWRTFAAAHKRSWQHQFRVLYGGLYMPAAWLGVEHIGDKDRISQEVLRASGQEITAGQAGFQVQLPTLLAVCCLPPEPLWEAKAAERAFREAREAKVTEYVDRFLTLVDKD